MTSKALPDLSFTRGGLPLSKLLLDLVSFDEPSRDAAGKAIISIWNAAPGFDVSSLILPADLRQHRLRLKEIVRSSLHEIEIPASDFVSELISLRMRLDEELIRFANRSLLVFDEVLFGATKIVFEYLSRELLLDRAGLRLMLDRPGSGGSADEAAFAITRIGKDASEYFQILLDKLDRGSSRYPWPIPSAVAAIARSDNDKLNQLMDRLHSKTGKGWEAAVWAVEEVGTETGQLSEAFIDYLLGELLAAEWNESRFAQLITAVASIGRDRADVLDIVVSFATAATPHWPGKESDGSDTFDVMVDRAFAIDALKYFQAFPDRVLPILVSALNDFKEFDIDLGYYGERYRVCQCLASFGPAACVAVPAIARILEDDLSIPENESEGRGDLFSLIAAIGERAFSLENLLIEHRMREMEAGFYDEYDPEYELARALVAIRRAHD